MTDTNFRARVLAHLREMYPQPEPDFSKLFEPKREAEPEPKAEAKPKPKPGPKAEPKAEVEPKPKPKAERVEAEPKAQDKDDNTDDAEPEPKAEPEPERKYFVRNYQNERLTTDQFNIQEGLRWVADHFAPAKQPDPEEVPPGHYASDDVSDEEYAAAYERYTGTAYRPRSHFIKSNTAL